MEEEVKFWVKGIDMRVGLRLFFVLGFLPIVIQLVNGLLTLGPVLKTVLLVSAILAAMLSFFAVLLIFDGKKSAVIARPSGLSFLSPARAIFWEDIQEVALENHGGFIGIKVRYRREGQPLLISRKLEDQQGFYNYVCAHAHADNPLRVWIEALPERVGKEL